LNVVATETITRAELPDPLRDALAALDDAGVRWSLLRPRTTLAEPQGDVDLLVEPSTLGSVAGLLEPFGFLEVLRNGPDRHFVTYDEPTARWIWLHFQAELRLAGSTWPAGPVLDQASGDELPEPRAEWLLWILLLRALVEKGELPVRHRARMSELAKGWEGGPPELEGVARRHGIDPGAVAGAAAAEDWESLLGQSTHRPAEPVACWRRVAAAPGKLGALRRLRGRRGLMVAVLGPDGAGKSSLVESLRRTLPFRTRVQYMGLTGGILPRVDRLRVPGVVFAGHVAVLWARYVRALYHRTRGEVIVFDRYTLDGAVPSGVELSPAGRLSRKLQRRACPMPDLVLFLDASGETMYARSGAYGAEVLESWRVAYRRLEDRVRVLERLDAERPAAEVLRDAHARIWRRYRETRARPQAG
jgi:thymidylate kinase